MDGARKPTPRLFLGLVIGLALAVLAFSQAAASIGLVIEGFRPLGESFFSGRAGQRQMALNLVTPNKRINPSDVEKLGRQTLIYSPLNTRSMWLVGKGMEMRGQIGSARRIMLRAEKISRRDGAVQLWLGTDDLRRNKGQSGLRHFDLLLRSDQDAAETLMPRLALIVLSPDGRRELAPYIHKDNPWLLSLYQTAVETLPRAEPLALLLLEQRKGAIDTPETRQFYNRLISRLAAERSYSTALRLYKLLPGANPKSLSNVSGIVSGRLDEGYPPFVWSFSVSDAQGAQFVTLNKGEAGLEAFGSPGTVGAAATKLLAPSPGDYLFWKVVERKVNLDSGATWEAVCMAGSGVGRKVSSTNMMDASSPLNRTLKLSMPDDCELVQLQLIVSGGIGRDPGHLIIGGLKLARDAGARQ